MFSPSTLLATNGTSTAGLHLFNNGGISGGQAVSTTAGGGSSLVPTTNFQHAAVNQQNGNQVVPNLVLSPPVQQQVEKKDSFPLGLSNFHVK